MGLELAGGNKLPELVADHVLGDEDGNMSLPIVDAEGASHKFRGDGAISRPGPDDLLLTGSLHLFHFLEKLGVDVDSFFKTSAHKL